MNSTNLPQVKLGIVAVSRDCFPVQLSQSRRSAIVKECQALGLEVCPANSAEDARQALHRMAKEGFAILYLTEQLAAQLGPELARYQSELTPAIILIPGKEGSLGIGMANVKRAVERAVGADIL